ncbi:hypothetical protein ACFQZI_17390 [Mucilaginibacter lutimaris]|uniref:Adhesin domain-containing protein n=1 Tax=Mucilaginibacter lutimaris TaxID=931629 RepID=A0ABW2ZKE7_9SPHI
MKLKIKIFNGLLTAIAVVAIGTAAFAQETPVQPPAPPQAPEVTTPKFDRKNFNKKIADLKVKMRDLKIKMKQKSFKADKDMAFAFKDFDKNFGESFKGFDKTFKESFKDFDKNFSANFKDFGKNFAGSFKEMAPDFSESFKNFNDISYNSDNYKEKLANGQVTEKVKNYSKSYSADANDVLQISNSFGKVVVNTWAKKEFKVDVQMKFGADDEEYVNNMINNSSISDSKVGSVVSFKTNLARNNGSNGDNHMEVNYTVYMPAGNAIDITNRYEDIVLPNLSGKVTIRLNFGNLIAQQLTNTQNDIQIKYTQDKTSSIAILNGGKFRVAYGKMKIGVLNNVEGDVSFSSVNVDKLKNSSIFRVKYGDGISISTIDKSVKDLSINASYTKVKVDFKGADNYNFDVVTKLGSFNYNDDNIKVTAKTPSVEDRGWSSTKIYKGYIGKNNSDGKIAINSSYTEVRFN